MTAGKRMRIKAQGRSAHQAGGCSGCQPPRSACTQSDPTHSADQHIWHQQARAAAHSFEQDAAAAGAGAAAHGQVQRVALQAGREPGLMSQKQSFDFALIACLNACRYCASERPRPFLHAAKRCCCIDPCATATCKVSQQHFAPAHLRIPSQCGQLLAVAHLSGAKAGGHNVVGRQCRQRLLARHQRLRRFGSRSVMQ